jgi:ParB/RepB/Spo0J family partition protein
MLADLLEAPGNPNVMAPEQFAALVATIKRDGFTQPILVRRASTANDWMHEIVDGVHRSRAAAEAGLHAVPCVVVEVSADKARALRISMNRLRGELNLSSVAEEFRLLAEAGWDNAQIAEVGFSIPEVSAMLEIAARDASGGNDGEHRPDSFAGSAPPPSEQTSWTLEIPFESKDDFARAKRRLRKIAGRGGSIASALLRVLAEDDEHVARKKTNKKAEA